MVQEEEEVLILYIEREEELWGRKWGTTHYPLLGANTHNTTFNFYYRTHAPVIR